MSNLLASALGHAARILPSLVVCAVLGACVAAPRIPYGDEEARRATVPGFAAVRTFADRPDPAFAEAVRDSLARVRRAGRPVTYLALSGGGGDGAYGAGVLSGWSESGTRPELTMVSGVSTGALISPFAFLGPDYDGVLRELYTSGIAETLLDSPDPIRAVFGESLFSNDRLRELVSRYVSPDIVAEVARQRARGRLLLVVTTNLDSQRPVLWDMGAIARDGSPRAVALFRDVLIASASIPAVFPPILIDAEAGGRGFQELHVDGSVTANVFTLPRSYLADATRPSLGGRASLFVILNAKIEPDFDLVSNNAPQVAARAVSTLVKDAARADLQDTVAAARRAGFEFNVTAIGRDVPDSSGVGFSTADMRRLYDLGYRTARSGRFWQKDLPGEHREASLR